MTFLKTECVIIIMLSMYCYFTAAFAQFFWEQMNETHVNFEPTIAPFFCCAQSKMDIMYACIKCIRCRHRYIAFISSRLDRVVAVISSQRTVIWLSIQLYRPAILKLIILKGLDFLRR